ncbi:MAG: hypothetical protein WCL14_10180 [Bacteroidota bacterium]
MNKKEAILKYFSAMDIEGLEMVLDDSCIYSGARKDVFLKKVGDVFERFRKGGDSELEIHKGKCGLKSCNMGSKGYCFMGNHSKQYINLIFFGGETDVTDIFQCSEFIIDVPEVVSMGGLSLIFGIDEKIGFVPSKWYLNTIDVCNRALEELLLIDSANQNKEAYIPWLKQYEKIYDELSMPFDYFQGFQEFIRRYCEIVNYTKS